MRRPLGSMGERFLARRRPEWALPFYSVQAGPPGGSFPFPANSLMPETRFRNLLVLAGPMFIGIASARLLYGVPLTHVAPLLVAGLIAFVGLAEPHQYEQLLLLGLAVFGVAGTFIDVRGMLGPPAPARPVEFVLSVAAAAVALTVARRRRAREE